MAEARASTHLPTRSKPRRPRNCRIERLSTRAPVLQTFRSEGATGPSTKTGAGRGLVYVPATPRRSTSSSRIARGRLTVPPSQDRNVRINCSSPGNGAHAWMSAIGRKRVPPRGRATRPRPRSSLENDIASPAPFPVVARMVGTRRRSIQTIKWTGGGWRATRAPGDTLDRSIAAAPLRTCRCHRRTFSAVARAAGSSPAALLADRRKGGAYNARKTRRDETAASQRRSTSPANARRRWPSIPGRSYKVRKTLYRKPPLGCTCRDNALRRVESRAQGRRPELQMATGVKKGVFATDGFALAPCRA